MTSGGGFVFAINIALGLSLLGGFGGAWLYDRRRLDAFWWFAAIAMALVSAAFELSLAYLDNARAPRFLLFATHLAALMLFVRGVAAHYGRPFRWTPILTFYAASLLLNIAIIDLPRQSLVRLAVYQSPYFLMTMLGALLIFRDMRGALEKTFFACTLIFALQFSVRPVIAALAGGQGQSPAFYLGSAYGLLTQAIFALSSLGMATLMLVLVMRAIILDLRQKGLHDRVSGLLNQSGFEEEVSRHAAQTNGGGNHAAFVLFEIDNADAIIDHGGDEGLESAARVVGQLVQRHKSETDIAGRLGGNTFAVLFPKLDTTAAAEWCEELRGMMALNSTQWDRGNKRMTASFGVTRRRPGEELGELLKRAREAIYRARQLGGDNICVRDRQRYVLPRTE
ncbi:MAG: GGDEF domain-containing protein [Notoacmeibacter sp.]|nr:GGDEF domain-containing protein [Notoacmeibacter sp.]